MEKEDITQAPASEEFAQVLKVASLFDQNFSIDWVIQLTEKRASTLLNILETASSRKILSKKEYGWFCFTGDDVQSSWQAQIPEEQKEALHRKIARILLEDLPDNEEKAKRIATHLLGLKNDPERCQWLAKAGDLYLKSLKVEEAAGCYTRLLKDLSKIKNHTADTLYVTTALKYSGMAEIKFDVKLMMDILTTALNRAEKVGDKKSQALIYMHMARNEWYRSNYDTAIKWFKTGWSLSENIPDQIKTQVTFTTFFHYWQGLFQDAVDLYEKNLSGDPGFPKENFPLMAASTVGFCYTLTGKAAQGLGMIDTVRSICAEQKNPFLQAFADIVLAISLLTMQRRDQALKLIQTCFSRASNWPDSPLFLFSTLLMAYAHFLKQDKASAVKFARKFVTHRARLEASMWPYPYVLELCWAMETSELPKVPGLSIEREIQEALRSGNVFLKGIACRYKAYLIQKKQTPEQVSDPASGEKIIAALKESEANLRTSGYKIELARTRIALANHLFAQGKNSKGQALIQAVSEELSAVGFSFLPDDLKSMHQTRIDDRKPETILMGIGQKIDDAVHTGEMLYHLISSAGQWVGAERGAVFIKRKDPSGVRVRLGAARNLTRELIVRQGFEKSIQIIEKTMEQGKGVIESRTSTSSRFPDEQVKSLICLPIRYKKKVVGALYHDNRLLPDLFDAKDLEVLNLYASVMGLVLANMTMEKDLHSIHSGSLDSADPIPTPRLGIIGQTRAVKNLFSNIERAASADVAVLIHGETGVGKELVANAIHMTSKRKNGPFIAVNCNALPDELIGSELFGHEKGAFTSAIHQRIGRFEQADQGTLFIDEIGEMSLDTQIRLLRVLQTREFERIGGHQTIHSNFRLIVATNRSLEQEISRGQFRSDLFYRLSTFPIHVPPLRERKADIPILARHFLDRHTLKTGKLFTSFPQAEMDKLMRYDWPGNVRELEHIIERGALLSRGALFEVPQITSAPVKQEARVSLIGKSLRQVEKQHIIEVLNHTRGKIRGQDGAAKLLDLNPSTLYSKMKKLGIKKQQL